MYRCARSKLDLLTGPFKRYRRCLKTWGGAEEGRWGWRVSLEENGGWDPALKNESRSLYVAGQIGEINVLAPVAASLQPLFSALSPPCREAEKVLHWSLGGEAGRRPSSPRGHIFCPIRLTSVWIAGLSHPVTWPPLCTCTFCVRPRWCPHPWPGLSLACHWLAQTVTDSPNAQLVPSLV